VSKAAGNIIQILADLPDFLRKPMLRNRLKEFYVMDKNDKRETIRLALSAAPSIDPAKLSILIKTWLEILSEFDAEKRTVMFQTYCEQIMSNPRSLEGLDFMSLLMTFLSLEQKKRESIIDSLKEVLFSLPNRNEILKVVPEDILRAVGLK
jgi:hypothetical protein